MALHACSNYTHLSALTLNGAWWYRFLKRCHLQFILKNIYFTSLPKCVEINAGEFQKKWKAERLFILSDMSMKRIWNGAITLFTKSNIPHAHDSKWWDGTINKQERWEDSNSPWGQSSPPSRSGLIIFCSFFWARLNFEKKMIAGPGHQTNLPCLRESKGPWDQKTVYQIFKDEILWFFLWMEENFQFPFCRHFVAVILGLRLNFRSISSDGYWRIYEAQRRTFLSAQEVHCFYGTWCEKCPGPFKQWNSCTVDKIVELK